MFALLWVPEVNVVFFDAVHALLRGLGVEEFQRYCGYDLYRFWRSWFGEEDPGCAVD